MQRPRTKKDFIHYGKKIKSAQVTNFGIKKKSLAIAVCL